MRPVRVLIVVPVLVFSITGTSTGSSSRTSPSTISSASTRIHATAKKPAARTVEFALPCLTTRLKGAAELEPSACVPSHVCMRQLYARSHSLLTLVPALSRSQKDMSVHSLHPRKHARICTHLSSLVSPTISRSSSLLPVSTRLVLCLSVPRVRSHIQS